MRGCVDSPMQAWGRQCMTRWAPSAGLPQRRMHCAVRRLRASHRPVRLRGRWAHTRYYKRLLTHKIKVGATMLCRRLPVHVASGSLCGRPRRRVHWGALLQRPLARHKVGQCRVDRCIRSGRGLSPACRSAEAQAPEVRVDLCTRQRFRQKVCWVFSSQHLVKTARLGPNEVLDPKLGHGKMADLADAAAATNADGRAAVCVDLGS